ncbi:zf-TFIIB domain-containing protein [Herbiconiux sp. L3-i23]|uniref:TFIIB-type zinc ribbon-containing protein n=1 Tax=Herbiconiux sp. L3-i23 TaxID=2905871 RepID=UPI00205480E8|nr:zf-TFIIB domain-containing protein [Herbiconiux sp. L3-i23]BDI23143.1 hypothetical protein L3i23_19190 [Herbiconiux sp. L3-i23]
MKCPNDNATLVMSERNGIEIDYCPECRGVWLDRGELDKIIERSGEVAGGPAPTVSHPPVQPGYPQQGGYPQQVPPQQYGRPYPQQQGYGYGGDGYRRKKKDNWLSELFD